MSSMELYMSKEIVKASEYKEGMEDTWVAMFTDNIHPEWVSKESGQEGISMIAALEDIMGTKTLIKKSDMIVQDGDMKYIMSSEDFHKKFKRVGR